MRRHNIAAGALAAALLLLLAAPRAEAFWELAGEQGEADLRGFFRLSGTTADNPPPRLLYPNEQDVRSLSIVRLIGKGYLGESLSVELNGFGALSGTTAPVLLASTEPYRSDALAWDFNEAPEATGQLAIDRLNVGLRLGALRLVAGRRPVSLAATFFFTPNDFFASFGAEQFFRAWKPGVDGLSAELALGDFSALAIHGVVGYEPDPDAIDVPSVAQSAAVGRASTVAGDFELALVGGRLPGGWALGADLQGTIGEWLGVRAEGHAFIDEEGGELTPEVALSLEHLFESSLNLQWESFYHGAGATDPADYLALALSATDAPRSPYLGRLYSGLAASYTMTPLLNGTVLALVNVLDPSASFSVHLLYSVSDEAELALTGSLPVGETTAGFDLTQPEPIEIGSEFGLAPRTIGADFRLAF